MKVILKNNWLLILILIIASLLRFVGSKPGYNQFHSDETIVYGVAVNMIRNGNLDPGRLDYPGVAVYSNYLVYRLFFIPLSWLRYYLTHWTQILEGTIHLPIAFLEAKTILQTYIFGHRELNVLFWGRYVTAVFGVGCVWLTYLLAKKLFDKTTGLIAALLLTFNFRHVLNSHLGLPDIYNAFFLLLLLLVALNLWLKPSLKNYLLAGITSGLFFSVKYQFVGFLPLLLIHINHAFENRSLNLRKLFSPRAFVCAFSIILVFLLVNPYFLINIENAFYWFTTIAQKYSMGIKLFNFYPYSYLYHVDYGPAGFIFIFIGLLLLIFREFKKALFLLSVIIPFFFLMTYYSYGGFYVRNFITTTPLLLIVGAYFVNWCAKKNKWVASVLLLVALYFPAKNSLISDFSYVKPWNYQVTADWMKNNLPKDVVVAAHPFDPPGGPEITKTEFKLGGAYGMTEHRENGAQYALINLDWASNPFYVWTNYGLKDIDKFWTKPVNILRNTYYGLAAEEMFRYQIFSATKPWQAPEAGLVLVKIPSWPVSKMKTVVNYSFDKGEDGWFITQNDQGKMTFVFDPIEGHAKAGSLRVGTDRSRMGIKRLLSPVIEIKAGYLYRVVANIKTAAKQTADKRSVFLRLTFYKDSPDNINLGIRNALSSRVYGTTDWTEKEITDRAPEEARFMTVGLQSSESENSEIWIDDVLIEESVEKVMDVTNYPPYVKDSIDLNVLYPYSHGNL